MPPKKSHKSARSHRSTLSLQKTEIIINVYDLLPPGKMSSFLWAIGTSLLHSGVVINGKEYAYGGHDKRGVTGVYWTKPRTNPPGGTFRCEILHGFTLATQSEIDSIIRDASEEFLGPSYNLLTKNCNHFTTYLCKMLTNQPGPSWLNRAASIGVAMPCVVPKDWLEPPDYETADGELLDEDDHSDERSRMLRSSAETPRLIDFQSDDGVMDLNELNNWDSEEDRRQGRAGKGKAPLRDSDGRQLPAAERAPTR
ncbi:DeSI-like protein sdu1 [Pleurostoma richardsiae]|uniref:DeSI-like protein sdu1 n=1 Tax=Pleurostoma richardsiae TaxID=41990 RepID=A0AA38SFB2_9PEZI|nr:DeSI-like protein sdu1 [Pleurostoma richardsiae]